MHKRDLLPGVVPGGCEPPVVCDSRRIILRARRFAVLRDVAQLLLVCAVDWMFFRWPLSHVPFFDRTDSLLILVGFNVLVGVHVVISRKLPQWNARRIASTWCPAERKRFATTSEAQRRAWR